MSKNGNDGIIKFLTILFYVGVAISIIVVLVPFLTPKNSTSSVSENSASVSAEKSDSTLTTKQPVGEVINVWLNFAVTIGNHSYVRININDLPNIFKGRAETPDNYHVIILKVINEFEKQHPELEVPPGAWKIEKQQVAYGYASEIFGLWIDHRPKPTEKQEPAQ